MIFGFRLAIFCGPDLHTRFAPSGLTFAAIRQFKFRHSKSPNVAFSPNPKSKIENPKSYHLITLSARASTCGGIIRFRISDPSIPLRTYFGFWINDHRITRSARARTFGGMMRPICLAVLRLITSSNFVGCSTGSSAGVLPFSILST